MSAPVVQPGVGDLGEGPFQDAHPHLVVDAWIAVEVDHHAFVLLFIGPGALEKELQSLAALEERDLDADWWLFLVRGLWLSLDGTLGPARILRLVLRFGNGHDRREYAEQQ